MLINVGCSLPCVSYLYMSLKVVGHYDLSVLSLWAYLGTTSGERSYVCRVVHVVLLRVSELNVGEIFVPTDGAVAVAVHLGKCVVNKLHWMTTAQYLQTSDDFTG